MDSSITENYLDYNSDQFDSWLEDFDSKVETLQSEIFTEESETEVKKENNIFIKKKTKIKPISVNQCSISKSVKVKPKKKLIEKKTKVVPKKPTRIISGVSNSRSLLLLRSNRIKRKKVKEEKPKKEIVKNKMIKKKIGWDNITLNDINEIIPEL